MKQILKNHLFLWRLCFKAAPGFMICWICEGIRYQGLIFLEHTVGIYFVLECAEYGRPFKYVLIFILGLLLLEGIQHIFVGYFYNNMTLKNQPKLYKALKEQMFEKASELDLTCYDDPEYYNHFVLSVAESDRAIDRFLDMLLLLSKSATGLITAGVFFLFQNPVGLVFVFLSFILTFLISQKLNLLNYQIRLQNNPHERKRNYTARVFYLNEYAKEVRLNPALGDILEEQFDISSEAVIDISKENAGKRWRLNFLRQYVAGNFITNGLYISFLVIQAAVLHIISFSSAVVLFNLIGSMKENLQGFSDVLPMTAENSLYVGKIREFLRYEPSLKPGIGKEAPKEAAVLEVKDVSFVYNKKDGDILHNINMILRPGEKIALVGYNGAGKTTLIKLLMRLYDPTSGCIAYHGEDIKAFELKSYRSRIGVVFQDYKIYAAALRENVILDDVEQAVFSDDEIITALAESGFSERLDSLENGLDTQLMTEFDEAGVNLSGGESQKVAISRVFYQNASLMIMDEPSSALDPIAEYQLNKAMERAAKNKTVIYISHRLSTTKDADRIYMLEKGRLIEAGTHDELVAKNGKYAEMWQAQAHYYVSAQR